MADKFTIIPEAVYEAFANGDLTPCMFVTLTLLHRWCGWGTGIVRKVRAGRMEDATNGAYAASSFQESLRDLRKAGWITDDHVQGSRTWYSVTIRNFTALMGPYKGNVINPGEIREWRRSRKSRRGEGQGEAVVSPEPDRDEAMTVLESSQESSQELALEFDKNSVKEESIYPSLADAELDPPSQQTDSPSGKTAIQLPEAEYDGVPPWDNQPGPLPAANTVNEFEASDEMRRVYACLGAVYVMGGIFDQHYFPFPGDKHVPRFKEYFNSHDCRDEKDGEELLKAISGFVDWIKSRPKLAEKFVSIKDFWFHFLNQSGRENGLRPQFETFKRSLKNKPVPPNAVTDEERADCLGYLEGDMELLGTPLSVEELLELGDL